MVQWRNDDLKLYVSKCHLVLWCVSITVTVSLSGHSCQCSAAVTSAHIVICFPGPAWQRLFKTTSGLWTGVTESSCRTGKWPQLWMFHDDRTVRFTPGISLILLFLICWLAELSCLSHCSRGYFSALAHFNDMKNVLLKAVQFCWCSAERLRVSDCMLIDWLAGWRVLGLT